MISAGGSGANGEFVAPGSSGSSASGLFAVSAGLDLVSGVFGYLSAQNAQSVANSRADMIRMNAQANAQRYAEKATADMRALPSSAQKYWPVDGLRKCSRSSPASTSTTGGRT